MCGILGSLNFNSNPIRVTSNDLERIKHRGPNGEGLYNDHYVSLGHVRLSIIDLTDNGAQPMSSEDGRFVITFNGEIYNYLELRNELVALGYNFKTNSDTEVLLKSYIEWKEECLEKVRGMFAFAIWDTSSKKLFLARDAFGEKPLIYWQNEDHFIFGSEYKGLLPLIPHDLQVDTDSLNIYLHYQFLTEPFCFFKGLKKLPPGHYLELTEGVTEASPVEYWNIKTPKTVNPLPRTYEEMIKTIENKLEESVKICLRSDVPVGIALSGGIDSGAIAAFSKKLLKDPLHVFSVGYPGKPIYDEREKAKKLSDELGFIYNEVEIPINEFLNTFPKLVSIIDEPIADIAAFAHYSVPKFASEKGIKVLLSGIGGDELFWGYSWVSECVEMNRMRKSFALSRLAEIVAANNLLKRGANYLKRRITTPNKIKSFLLFATNFEKIISTPTDQLVWYELNSDFDFAQSIAEKQKANSLRTVNTKKLFSEMKMEEGCKSIPFNMMESLNKTWLVSNCLNLGDRVSMAVGVETRLPLLDKRLAEMLMSYRLNCEDHYLEQKKWLKDSLAPLLPQEVLRRPKSGFRPPIEEWAYGVVKKYGNGLETGFLVKLGIFDRNLLEELRGQLEGGNPSARMYMYKMTLLELWLSTMNQLVEKTSGRRIQV